MLSTILMWLALVFLIIGLVILIAIGGFFFFASVLVRDGIEFVKKNGL